MDQSQLTLNQPIQATGDGETDSNSINTLITAKFKIIRFHSLSCIKQIKKINT